MSRADLDRAWATILAHRPLEDDRPAVVTTREMKDWTHREPRLLAKMDTARDVPRPLREAGRFVFPVSGQAYALVRGSGHHRLEDPAPAERRSWGAAARWSTLALGAGESRAVDTAFHTGMIEDVFDLPARPALTLRGRRYAPPFAFRAGGQRVEVGRGVQFELDAGFDAGDALVLLEAKVGRPADLCLRQLYVPWRAWRRWLPAVDLRVGFLAFDDATGEYRFWRWRWTDDEDIHALELVARRTFVLTADAPLGLADLLARVPPRELPRALATPQADRLERVLQVPLLLTTGRTDAADLADALGFTVRQGQYHLAAARSLGLVEPDGSARLTAAGRALATAGPGRREPLAAAALLGLPVLRAAIDTARARPDRLLSREHVEELCAAHGASARGTSTVRRRAGTIWAWLRWLELRVDGLRTVTPGRTMAVEDDA